jgi:MYXO-CTERM domain-containing protein
LQSARAKESNMTRSATLTVLLTALVSLPAVAAPRAQAVRSPQPNLTMGTDCKDVPHLAYPSTNGGPLIQSVKVVDVFYSPGHKYKAMLEDFYKAILQSPYFDWLTEYNVGSYKISRGSFVTSFEDTNANPTTVMQVNPETYLKGLITANKVPPPDDNTMYMLYFPSGVDPTDGSGPSCISNGDYCAYHSNFTTGGKNVRYGVMPDMEAGDCNMGCGPMGFDSFTDVSSHELIEAVTDPDGTAWYDDGATDQSGNNCGEIGDICAVGGTAEGATVAGFFVQNEWSDKNKKCIAVDPNAVVNDFTLAVSPTEISVPAGGSADVTVTLTKTTGVAENIALTAPTPPTGLTASFAPASATSASGTSTLTIAAGPSLTAGTALMLTVKGAGSTASHTATVNVNVIAAVPPDMATGGGGTGGNGGSGGSGGGSGNHGGSSGCSVAGGHAVGGFAVSWPVAALLLLAFALRRRRTA